MIRPSAQPAPLRPSIRHYAWGHLDFIPEVLGHSPTGEPWAEAWFGAHPLASAEVVLPEGPRSLNALISEQPEATLGEICEGGRLPYLLKILAAARPLSIQVHPTRAQARAGFAAEEAAGVPRGAPHRRYRDSNHKPEVLVALTPFEALCGFQSPEAIARHLEGLPELASRLPPFEASSRGVAALLEAWFALPLAEVASALEALLGRLRCADDAGRGPEARLLLRIHEAISDGGAPDRGLLFVFLLNHLTLSPGQAMYLPAGVPHAYLGGAGVELMASSDNVLRAGLTPKHVDPAELMKVVRFDARDPVVVTPVEDEAGLEGVYPIPAEEFELRRLRMDAGQRHRAVAHGPEILLVIPQAPGASVRVRFDGGEVELARGQQGCFIPSGAAWSIEADGLAHVYRVAVPGGGESGMFRGRNPKPLAFGTSGLRGLVTDITDLEAYINTRGFMDFLVATGDAVPGTPVAIGGDLRPSTDSPERSILRAVARAIRDSGLSPVYCGRLPTPALTYYGLQQGWPSVMVTGSHIPFDRNGIKFNKRAGEVLKTDEAPILAAVARVRARVYGEAAQQSIFDDAGWLKPEAAQPLPEMTGAAIEMYRRRYLDAFPAGALEGLRLAFYEHSAVGREIIADLLRELGAEVHAVGRSTRFVAIDTEAIAAERLVELQRLADEVQREVGPIDGIVSTDGDSDRPMLLGVGADGQVRFFGGDILGVVVAEALGADALAVPISANDLIDAHFAPLGVEVARTRIGSPWVIAAMDTLSGERRVGWEANGGFLTGSTLVLEGGALPPLPTRDAVLPLVAALYSARKAGCPLGEVFDRLPKRFSKAGLLDEVPRDQSLAALARLTPELPRLRQVHITAAGVEWVSLDGERRVASAEVAERVLAIRALLAAHFTAARGFGALRSIDYLDGVRMAFDNGDVAHLRPSGNAPQLRIYAVASAEARAAEIVALALAEPDGVLRSLLG